MKKQGKIGGQAAEIEDFLQDIESYGVTIVGRKALAGRLGAADDWRQDFIFWSRGGASIGLAHIYEGPRAERRDCERRIQRTMIAHGFTRRFTGSTGARLPSPTSKHLVPTWVLVPPPHILTTSGVRPARSHPTALDPDSDLAPGPVSGQTSNKKRRGNPPFSHHILGPLGALFFGPFSGSSHRS